MEPEPEDRFWRPLEITIRQMPDGTFGGTMLSQGQFRSWVRRWRKENGVLRCETQEFPDPAWLEWQERTLKTRMAG